MPFPQIAKDNLVVALSLANLFTDESGGYLPLPRQIEALHELQKYLGWQIHNLYQSGIPGRNIYKQVLRGYLKLESTIDLFMRYMDIPACQVQTNLSYLSENVQKLIYAHFKQKTLREAFYESRPLSLAQVTRDVRSMVKEKVQGYVERLPDQSQEEWQLFVAEIDIGIEVLSRQYEAILRPLYEQFHGFRKGHVAFTQNYFDRCMFLAKLEEWLIQAPFSRSYPLVEDTKIDAFCQKLAALEASHNEINLQEFFSQLAEFQKTTLKLEQYKSITEALVRLKPKYDAYRLGQGGLTPEALMQKFIANWPKPKLPRLVTSSTSKEADQNWARLRAQDRERKEKEEANELKHKQSAAAKEQRSSFS